MGIDIVRFWRSIGSVLIIPIVICFSTLFFYKIVDFYNMSILVIGILVFTILYITINWSFVMNMYEKNIVRNIFNRIKFR